MHRETVAIHYYGHVQCIASHIIALPEALSVLEITDKLLKFLSQNVIVQIKKIQIKKFGQQSFYVLCNVLLFIWTICLPLHDSIIVCYSTCATLIEASLSDKAFLSVPLFTTSGVPCCVITKKGDLETTIYIIQGKKLDE